jgi:HTH-type transcriptional regulator, sugar sensing transcriptional regulator
MQDMNNLIQQFKDLGIAERETKTYLALLERGESNANELHRITGLQRTKMYAVLSRMAVRGLCHERVEGRNRFFSAVDPNTVLDTLRNQWKIELAIRDKTATDILANLADSFKNHESNKYLDSIEVIRNKMQIHRKYLTLMAQTKREVCAFNRPPFSVNSLPAMEEQFAAQEAANKRGVRNRTILIKGVTPIEDFEYPELDTLDEMRFAPSLPIKLFVFDARRVFMALPSALMDVQDFSMVLIDDPGFATLAQIAFEQYWDNATPLTVLLDEHHNGTKQKKE